MRRLSPEGVDTRQCFSKDTGPEREWIKGSHIDWRRERVPARMLGLKGGGLWDLTSVGEKNETFFIRVWKPLPIRRVLKTLRGKPERESPKRIIFASDGLKLLRDKCGPEFKSCVLAVTISWHPFTPARSLKDLILNHSTLCKQINKLPRPPGVNER